MYTICYVTFSLPHTFRYFLINYIKDQSFFHTCTKTLKNKKGISNFYVGRFEWKKKKIHLKRRGWWRRTKSYQTGSSLSLPCWIYNYRTSSPSPNPCGVVNAAPGFRFSSPADLIFFPQRKQIQNCSLNLNPTAFHLKNKTKIFVWPNTIALRVEIMQTDTRGESSRVDLKKKNQQHNPPSFFSILPQKTV